MGKIAFFIKIEKIYRKNKLGLINFAPKTESSQTIKKLLLQ